MIVENDYSTEHETLEHVQSTWLEILLLGILPKFNHQFDHLQLTTALTTRL